jgi:hypothetical protein
LDSVAVVAVVAAAVVVAVVAAAVTAAAAVLNYETLVMGSVELRTQNET